MEFRLYAFPYLSGGIFLPSPSGEIEVQEGINSRVSILGLHVTS